MRFAQCVEDAINVSNDDLEAAFSIPILPGDDSETEWPLNTPSRIARWWKKRGRGEEI